MGTAEAFRERLSILGNTYFWIDPAKGIAGVILMQLIPFADPKALAVFDRFEKAVYASLG